MLAEIAHDFAPMNYRTEAPKVRTASLQFWSTGHVCSEGLYSEFVTGWLLANRR